MKFSGGCLCGAVRYAIDAAPIDAGFCHCRICQRSSGAPAVAWATFHYPDFAYLSGEIGVYRSSRLFRREFCPECGTQLVFRAESGPHTIDVTVCSLDDPSAIEPEYHIWCASKASWLHLDDALPQFADAGPDRD